MKNFPNILTELFRLAASAKRIRQFLSCQEAENLVPSQEAGLAVQLSGAQLGWQPGQVHSLSPETSSSMRA